MSSLIGGGFFLCYVIVLVFLTIAFGAPAFAALVLTLMAYAAFDNGFGRLEARFKARRSRQQLDRRIR
jgi:hypothetical protein